MGGGAGGRGRDHDPFNGGLVPPLLAELGMSRVRDEEMVISSPIDVWFRG